MFDIILQNGMTIGLSHLFAPQLLCGYSPGSPPWVINKINGPPHKNRRPVSHQHIVLSATAGPSPWTPRAEWCAFSQCFLSYGMCFLVFKAPVSFLPAAANLYLQRVPDQTDPAPANASLTSTLPKQRHRQFLQMFPHVCFYFLLSLDKKCIMHPASGLSNKTIPH